MKPILTCLLLAAVTFNDANALVKDQPTKTAAKISVAGKNDGNKPASKKNKTTDPETKANLVFKNAQALPFPLYYHACTTDSNYVYTISGESGSGMCTQALKYDQKNNSWSLLAHNLKPTLQATASYVPSTGKIYVIGGINSIRNFTYFDKVETIDVKTGKVEILKVTNPAPIANAGSAVWNNKIYIFGGGTDLNSTTRPWSVKTVYEFDPATQRFTRLPDMPEAAQTTGTVINGILYAVGGYQPQTLQTTNAVYAYNIAEKKWSKFGELPRTISANSIAAHGSLIFVAGGDDNQDFFGYLNTEDGKFTRIKSNFSGRKNAAAAVMGNELLIIGGVDNIVKYAGLNNVQAADLSPVIAREQ